MFLQPYFTGKETDCETGYSYFGARYYDPTILTSWTAIDPMSDDYPNMSPYHYCHWDPICLIDPSGMCDDGWEVQCNGQVLHKNNNGGKETQKVTHQAAGNDVTYSGTEYYDIFSDLCKKHVEDGGRAWVYKSICTGDGKENLKREKALVDVFYDMATNKNVEWALYEYGKTLALGTCCWENFSPTLCWMGCCNSRIKGKMLHSHPNTVPSTEYESMGWFGNNKTSGDYLLRQNSYENMDYYVFMKKSRHLHSLPSIGGKKPRREGGNVTKTRLYELFSIE